MMAEKHNQQNFPYITPDFKGEGEGWKNKNKILMVISYPDIRLKKELESFKRNGYDVSLIIWERSWPFPLDQGVNEVKSLKLDTPLGNKTNLFYFPLWWSFLLFWMLKMDWDVVHSVNFDTFFLSVVVAKMKGKHIVYDIYDFYGDMMHKILRPTISALDRFIMKFADAIVIADDSRISQVDKDLKTKMVTINNTPEDDLFSAADNWQGDAGKFKIFLGGKIVEERGTHRIISIIKDIEDVQLIIKGFCSPNKYKMELTTMAQGMEDVYLELDGVPYNKIVQSTLEADLTIALYDPNIPNNKYASPNKLFEAMASGIPIIVNDNTPMADMVREEDCGLVIPFNNDNSLKEAILRIRDDVGLRQRLGKNGRKAFQERYNWDIMENRLINIYKQFEE